VVFTGGAVGFFYTGSESDSSESIKAGFFLFCYVTVGAGAFFFLISGTKVSSSSSESRRFGFFI